MGHDSHGVGLAPRYMKHARAGTMKLGVKPTVVSDNGVYLLLDGNMGYGQTICREATEMAIARAKDKGAAIVGLRRTHHMGRIGAWGGRCARAGQTGCATCRESRGHYVWILGVAVYLKKK